MGKQLDAAERRNSLLKEHCAIAGRFVHDIVLLLDEQDATIVEANDRAVDAYGYAREELFARSMFDLRHEGSAEQSETKQRFAALRATGGGSYLTRHWRKDGSSFPVEISARPCELDGCRYVQIIGRDITERIQIEERLAVMSAERTTELEQAKNAAEHSDRVKSAFLSTMSHELRTPLNSILGFTDVLLQGLSGPLSESQQRQLRIVRDSAAHLRSLIEDVLDVARIEAGQIALEFTDVDVRDLVSRRVEAFGPEYERKGIMLEVHAAGGLPTIRSDCKRTGQVVNNLLSNALKFTDKGSVTVDIRCAAEHLELRVIDTGVGIPASALTHLFKPFTQVIRPGGRMNEGTGLGLAISRNLARALGGDLSVESEVGHGSCFTFRLPRVAREVDVASASGVFPRLHVRRPLPHDAAHDTALSASTQP